MAMGGILAEADICNDEELREALAKEADGGHDRAFWVIGSSSKSIFGTWRNRYTKEYDGAESFADEGFEEGDDFIEASTVLIGKRGNEDFFIILVGDEKRVDKHRLGEESAAEK